VNHHHPTETTLAAYAGGALPEALGLVVATHLHGCAQCRRLKSLVEAVGGTELDTLPPTALADDALARVLARIERPVVRMPPIARSPGLPPPLDACAFGPWRRVGIGLRWRPLTGARTLLAGLLEAVPGKALPTHGHNGLELTCVLEGSFVDAGQRFATGDLAEVEGDHRHNPVIDGDRPCLCFVATEGVRFDGWLGMAQRWLG